MQYADDERVLVLFEKVIEFLGIPYRDRSREISVA